MTDEVALGTLVDRYYAAVQKVKTAEAKIAPLKEVRDSLEAELIAELGKAKATGARGRKASATVQHVMVPSVEDWPAFEKYVYANKALDLVQRRVSSTAWRDRLAENEVVPGITAYNRISIRIAGL